MWFLNILYGTVPWFLKKNIQSRRNVNIDVVGPPKPAGAVIPTGYGCYLIVESVIVRQC